MTKKPQEVDYDPIKERKSNYRSRRLQQQLDELWEEFDKHEEGSEIWKQLYIARQTLSWYDDPFIFASPLNIIRKQPS